MRLLLPLLPLVILAGSANAEDAPAPIGAATPATASGTRSLSLADALQAAASSSKGVAIAEVTSRRAQGDIERAKSARLPQVTGVASYQRTLISEYGDISFGADLPFGQANTWRAGVSVSQGIYDGGRTAAAIRLSKASAAATTLGVGTSRTAIVQAAAQAYFDAALALRQVEIASSSLAQAEATLADAELAFKNDAVPEFDVLRAEVARDNQRSSLEQYKLQRELVLVQLRHAIGVPIDQELELTTSLDDDDPAAVATLVRQAAGLTDQAPRAAIASAEAQVAVREASLGVANAERRPTISAATDLGFVDYATQPFNSDWRTSWTIGVSLSVPIFDGFRRKAAISAARADVLVAQLQLEDASQRDDVQRVSAEAAVATARSTWTASARTVSQAKRAYEIAELRYEQGASTHLELVDARLQLEQAQLVRARSARDLRVAVVRENLLAGLPLGAP